MRKLPVILVLAVATWTHSALAQSDECEIHGLGGLENGDSFIGALAEGSGPGDASGHWVHIVPGEGVAELRPQSVSCTINGVSVANIAGDARLNGVRGFQFLLNVVDIRDPRTDPLVEGTPAVETLTATRRQPARIDFDPFARVALPASLRLTGPLAGGWATLKLWERGNGVATRCVYFGSGSGDSLEFGWCVGPDAQGLTAGEQLDVSRAALRVSRWIPRRNPAMVSADLDVVPLRFSTTPDEYTISVFTPEDFLSVLTRSSVVDWGDLQVSETPGSP